MNKRIKKKVIKWLWNHFWATHQFVLDDWIVEKNERFKRMVSFKRAILCNVDELMIARYNQRYR